MRNSNAEKVLDIIVIAEEISRKDLVRKSRLSDSQVRQAIHWLQINHFTGEFTIVANLETKKYHITSDPDLINSYCDYLHGVYVLPILEKIRFLRGRIKKEQFEMEV